MSLSATQSGGGGSTAGGQGKKDASTKEGPDSSGKDKNEDENKKVMFIDKDCSEKNETGLKMCYYQKIVNFCPILMKLCQNDYLMDRSNCQNISLVAIRLWIFY